MNVPLKTPKDIVLKINLELVKALKNPELQERFFAVGADAAGTTPEEFGTFLQGQSERWSKLLKEGGAKPPQ
jgi:tripartite-type tricarboxylate transporter receptor subunit TctC